MTSSGITCLSRLMVERPIPVVIVRSLADADDRLPPEDQAALTILTQGGLLNSVADGADVLDTEARIGAKRAVRQAREVGGVHTDQGSGGR